MEFKQFDMMFYCKDVVREMSMCILEQKRGLLELKSVFHRLRQRPRSRVDGTVFQERKMILVMVGFRMNSQTKFVVNHVTLRSCYFFIVVKNFKPSFIRFGLQKYTRR